jgi:hypothetical protein
MKKKKMMMMDDVMGDDVISFSSPYWIKLKLSGLVM